MEAATTARLEAERRWLADFLLWAFWALLVFGGLQLAGGLVYGADALLVTAGLSFAYAVVLLVGTRSLVGRRLAQGLVAVPYLTKRTVWPLVVGFVAWAMATALIGELASDHLEIPRAALVTFRVSTIVTMTLLLCPLLWRSRERTDHALRVSMDSDRRMRDLIEGSLDAVISIQEDGRIIGWNPQAEATFGWKREEAEGRVLADMIVPPALRDGHRAGLERTVRTGDGPLLNKRIEVPALDRSGREIPIELTIVPIEIDGKPTFSAFVRDLSERQEIERERRSLLRRIVQAQEDERRRVAVGLHDDAVQQMTAVGLRIATLRAKEGHLDERLQQIEEVADRAVEALRRFLFELSPPAFERGGLVAATESFAAQLGLESGFRVEVVDATERSLDEETQIVAYRVVQEALTNVARHAAARIVSIAVSTEKDELHVVVHDDGRGFDPETTAGAGLGAMRERAALVGGRVTVRSAPGQGVTVDLWLPASSLDGGEGP
jgi:PAS domain S-box-containing protein